MEEIHVNLRKPTARGRLYPHYDEEANLLEVQSSVSRDWPYGVDIDNRLVFDLDADHIVANFDLLIRKSLWRVDSTFKTPLAVKEADLEFSQVSIRHKSFSLPLEIKTNDSRSYVTILFGKQEKRGIWIALSEKCLALLVRDRLKGFFVTLK